MSQMVEQKVSWTMLDEYTSVIRRVCQKLDFELRTTGWEGDNPKTTRRFTAESRTQPVVELESQYPWGQTCLSHKTLPNVKVQISIFTNDPNRPVMPLRERLPVYGSYSRKEQEEYARLQDAFVTSLLEEVDQIRKKLAQEQVQIQSLQPTQPEITAMPILGIEKSKQKRKLGRITLSFSLALVSVCLGIIGNVAANQLPSWLQSYLPFSLPVFLVLALLFVAFSVFQVYAE